MWNASQQLIALQGKNLFSYRSVAGPGPSQKQSTQENIKNRIENIKIEFLKYLAEIEELLKQPPIEHLTKEMDIKKEEKREMRDINRQILLQCKESLNLNMSQAVELLSFLNEEVRKTTGDELVLEIEQIPENVIITPQDKQIWIHSLKQKFTAYVVEDPNSS